MSRRPVCLPPGGRGTACGGRSLRNIRRISFVINVLVWLNLIFSCRGEHKPSKLGSRPRAILESPLQGMERSSSHRVRRNLKFLCRGRRPRRPVLPYEIFGFKNGISKLQKHTHFIPYSRLLSGRRGRRPLQGLDSRLSVGRGFAPAEARLSGHLPHKWCEVSQKASSIPTKNTPADAGV